jgi:SAM-dependent MidA family methyltransferase
VNRETSEPAVAGYRVERLPDPASVGEDDELVERLSDEIRRTGPITFARFMARALYEPGPGRAGDFLTAPEAHPIFGAAVGRLVAQGWEALGRPAPFTITEPGAGTGAMAAGLLAGLRDDASAMLERLRYRPVEVEPARLDALRARLAIEGFDGHLVGDEAEAPDAEPEAGAVIANEVLDALPVHRVIGRPDGLRELLVGLDVAGSFAWVEAEPTTPELAARLASEGITLAEGQITEVCLAIDDWLADATSQLARGIVVLIDYALEPAALHGPTRPTGTLRAFARHAVGADPFRHVGRADLTATVDLAAVRTAAVRTGLAPLGETTAAELLAAVGNDLPGRYLTRPGVTLQDGFTLRSALARLLDPRGLGGFRVLVFGRGLPDGTRLEALRRFRRPGAPPA